MSVLGLVQPTTSSPTVAVPELHMEEAIAASGRLWVRGRLFDPTLKPIETSHWWDLRAKTSPALQAQLETHVGGQAAHAIVALGPDGTFDAAFPMELPPARRGWRLARNRLTWMGKSLERCSVVVTPADDAQGAVVVLLPSACTQGKHGAKELAEFTGAGRWTPQFQRWQHRPEGPRAFFYLACVPPGEPGRQAELALSATTLGWPAGSLILLPGSPTSVLDCFAAGIDRLRWLLADRFKLTVVNLEPALALTLASRLAPAEDRADVQLMQQPDAALVAPTVLPGMRPTRSGMVPRHKIVFCHGLLAFSTFHLQVPDNRNYFSPLRDFFNDRGYQVLYPEVAPVGSVAIRAAQLREQIQSWTSEPVNLIAHSMGGLDARYLITRLGMADRVCSLTTIATPHHGTVLADWFMTNFQQRVPLVRALEALGASVAGFADCRPSACALFNESVPDMPRIKYFSFGGEVSVQRLSPMLRRAWNMLTALEGPNDGLVSAASAHWGEYLGTIHADHFAQTPDMVFVRPGEDYDPLAFYSRLVEDLARRGF
jgi:triacylglycerol lipase